MIQLYNTLTEKLARADWLLPTLARVVFAGVLLMYFWISGLTKLGDGLWGIVQLSDSAYIQIFPKTVEAVGYDTSQLAWYHQVIALGGTWAELILPLFIVIGLLTRLSALGMIGFVIVQSVVDIVGHGVSEQTIGAWFDHVSNATIVDQRALWLLLLAILVVKGAGPISVDRALRPWTGAPREA